MWKIAPESKIQLVSCKMSPYFLLGISALVDTRTIDVYIFCDSLPSVLFCDVLFILFDLYARVLGFSVFQWKFLSRVSSFGQFSMKWSSDTHLKHVFGFQKLRSLRYLLELCVLKVGFLYPYLCICCLKTFSVGCEPPQWLHLDWEKQF